MTTAKISPGTKSGSSLIKIERRRLWKVNNSLLGSREEDGVMGKAQNFDFDSSLYLIKSKVNILTYLLKHVSNLEHYNCDHFSPDISSFNKKLWNIIYIQILK